LVRILVLIANIRLGQNWLQVTNTVPLKSENKRLKIENFPPKKGVVNLALLKLVHSCGHIKILD
jgi:hypothetical protein